MRLKYERAKPFRYFFVNSNYPMKNIYFKLNFKLI